MRRVELFELIRHDHFDFGLSQRQIAHKRGVHRRIVAQAVASAVPPERKLSERTSSKLTPQVKAFIDRVLTDDKAAPRKQRHTSRRIWQRLRDETGSTIGESTVRNFVGIRRRELGIGAQAFVPQHHPIGSQFEVDFYEAYVDFSFGRRKARVITVRSEFSGAAFHVAYPSQTQSALLEGMVKGLEFCGGVPARIRFDNLTQAVARIVAGRRRIERDRFIAFRSHYLFESSFTTPGIEGAHEKGGVEGEVGRFRRRWLTPVPKFDSWEELNGYLAACCVADLDRVMQAKGLTVGQEAAMEREFLRPLPAEPFEVAEVAEARVDQKSRVTVRRNRYSVPVGLVGRKVAVRLTPLMVEVSYGDRVVATHDRLHFQWSDSLKLDHYLDVFADKPGAFPGSLPLHQARATGEFSSSYEQLWRRFRQKAGEKQGTRLMIEVLLLHRIHGKEVVRKAIDQALEAGVTDPGAVGLFARHIKQGTSFDVAPLAVGELSRYDRPLPDTASYNVLLQEAVTR
jgi:transposase